MSGISEASGVIRFWTESRADAERIISVMNERLEGNGDYCTFVWPDLLEGRKMPFGKGWHGKTDFCGTGKWEYSFSIEHLGEMLETDELNSIPFVMQFSFADFECGQPRLCLCLMTGTHEKDTPLSSIEWETDRTVELPVSRENLVSAGFTGDEAPEIGREGKEKEKEKN